MEETSKSMKFSTLLLPTLTNVSIQRKASIFNLEILTKPDSFRPFVCE